MLASGICLVFIRYVPQSLQHERATIQILFLDDNLHAIFIWKWCPVKNKHSITTGKINNENFKIPSLMEI